MVTALEVVTLIASLVNNQVVGVEAWGYAVGMTHGDEAVMVHAPSAQILIVCHAWPYG